MRLPIDRVDTGNDGAICFGSVKHVFAALDGNVHFDGHVSFQTAAGASIVATYQVKHNQIRAENSHFYTWDEVYTWLETARDSMSNYDDDAVKVFVMSTNNQVRPMKELPHDFCLVRSENLASFFAPCLLASAKLAGVSPSH